MSKRDLAEIPPPRWRGEEKKRNTESRNFRGEGKRGEAKIVVFVLGEKRNGTRA